MTRVLGGRLRPASAAIAVAWAGALALALCLHGFAPGTSQPELMSVVGPGLIECLHHGGLDALHSWCMDIGAPLGTPLMTGLPELYVGWALSFVPGIDAWRAHQISNALFDAASLTAGYHLMRRWRAPRWIALLVATQYLTSISLLYLNGFLYTFTGFVLLPVYVLVALWCLDALDRGRRVAPLTAMAALAPVMAFTDGYSFFAGNLLIGVLGLRWVIRGPSSRRVRLTGLLGWIAANAIALAAYIAYVPGATRQTIVGIGAFRYLGLDISTLVLPVRSLWWPSWIGWDVTYPPLWGDGSNFTSNYAGIVAIALLAWFLIAGSRTIDGRHADEARALVIAGGLALILSLGPALKVYDVAVPIPVVYDVPDRLTTLPLPPLRWLYESVPGFNDMRATYRWFIATRFVLVFGSGMALVALSRRPTRAARITTVLLAVALIAETVPNLGEHLRIRHASARQTRAVRAAILPEARALIHPHELVLALPTTGNDFMTFALIPFTGARSYNVGIDKNSVLSAAAWPASIHAAIDRFGAPSEPDTVCQIFGERLVDVLVLPYFDLFSQTFVWPPTAEAVDTARTRAARLGADLRFITTEGTWMTTIRPRPGLCGR